MTGAGLLEYLFPINQKKKIPIGDYVYIAQVQLFALDTKNLRSLQSGQCDEL